MSQSVLVTGASRGIGRQIAERLARAGYDVAVHCRRRVDAAEAACKALQAQGASARVLQFDVGDRQAAADVLAADMAAHGAYYGVVCNAGTHRDAAFPAMRWEEWDSVIRINLDGFYNVLHPVVMPMVRARRGGRIVVMASLSGLIGNRGQVNYSAAKGGLIAAAKALAVELAKRHITVNCVAPGLIDTAREAGSASGKPAHHDRNTTLVGRRGRPEEVAAAVRYLVGPNARYVTGQTLHVNGGAFLA
jgi:3-oxoacyl-[acyl-carrier protein] reductase